jgi:hypothetical protein
MVMGYVPGITARVALIVKIVFPPVASIVGANVAVAPEGNPVVPNVTVEAKPPATVIVAV